MYAIHITSKLYRNMNYNLLHCQNAVKQHKSYINMLGGMFANHSRWFGIPKVYTLGSRRNAVRANAEILQLGMHKLGCRSLKSMPMG